MVTVLGLGPMGQALAAAFLTSGHPTAVWNRTPAKADALVARGAVRAETPADGNSLVVACLRDDDAVGQVVEPVVADLQGRTLVNFTSTSPAQARRRASWAAERGIAYLDGAIMTPTPTIGTPSAQAFYSGPEDVYAENRPVLASLGGTATHLGTDPGRASAFDTALLDAFWMSVYGLVHSFALANAEGIEPSELTPYAKGISGLLPEMVGRFAQQLSDGVFPGEVSNIASGLSGLQHIIETSEANGVDAGALIGSAAVMRRAVDEGHSADGLARLAEVLGRPSALGQ